MIKKTWNICVCILFKHWNENKTAEYSQKLYQAIFKVQQAATVIY